MQRSRIKGEQQKRKCAGQAPTLVHLIKRSRYCQRYNLVNFLCCCPRSFFFFFFSSSFSEFCTNHKMSAGQFAPFSILMRLPVPNIHRISQLFFVRCDNYYILPSYVNAIIAHANSLMCAVVVSQNAI